LAEVRSAELLAELRLVDHGIAGATVRPVYMMAFLTVLQDLGGFVQSVGFRRQRFQRRGWHLGGLLEIVSVNCQIKNIPRNSTQFISISSLSPSADNGTSSSRLRRTYGPCSEARLLIELASSARCFSSMARAV